MATTMDFKLTLDKVLASAEQVHGAQQIVTRRPDGSTSRYTFRDMAGRARRLAAALIDAGLKPGERVASLMWNNSAHLEAYYGVPMAGGILHTVNVRFHPEEISYVLSDAQSRFLIVDDVLLPLWRKVPDGRGPERVLVHNFSGTDQSSDDYERFLASAPCPDLPELTSERAGATLCYTGGTTGRPKGVVYSHRALVLHALCEMSSAAFGYGIDDSVLPAVPMFHVNAWGIPYSTLMSGAKLVLPGQNLDGKSLLNLAREEGVTFLAGVPTIWSQFLDGLNEDKNHGLRPDLRILTGGAAPHRSLIEGLARHGVPMFQGWGMTETSGVVTVSHLKPEIAGDADARLTTAGKQGLPLPIAQVRIASDGQRDREGHSIGSIQVRGTSVAGAYLNNRNSEKWTEDGWFRTGDIGSIDAHGYLSVLEREEDLIKSGGEWIAPRDLEDAILEFPWITGCAVVGRSDIKWGERPIAFVILSEDAPEDWAPVREKLTTLFPKYWLPDDFVAVTDIPHTSVGKIDRKALKAEMRGDANSGPAARTTEPNTND